MELRRAVVIAATCVLLQELSRDVLQERPQRIERVTAIEWCADGPTYVPEGGAVARADGRLHRATRFFIDRKEVGEPQEDVVLWPKPSINPYILVQ